MLISCKCLNFIATSNTQQQLLQQLQQKSFTSTPVATADVNFPLVLTASPNKDCDIRISPNSNAKTSSSSTAAASLANALMHAFLKKYPRNFPFYSQCMDFFKQSIGPIPDLSINAINQTDLVYSFTLEFLSQTNNNNNPNTQSQKQAWQISFCINCNTVLCAKRVDINTQNSENLQAGENMQSQQQQQYLINCSLLTNNEELMYRRSDKSFSETFGILIMDHPQLENFQQKPQSTGYNSTIGQVSMGFSAPADPKQQRLKQLQYNLQVRLQKEIVDTDERIQRYTEQQFALLESFREKSEQEYQLLANLIQNVPDQCEVLDPTPALAINNVSSYAQRRRNTIGSRLDLNTPQATALTMHQNAVVSTQNQQNFKNAVNDSTIAFQKDVQTSGQRPQLGANNSALNASNNRKLSNLDTPPATPEATPMSVGNSPTFRQQQQQNNNSLVGRLYSSNSFQQQFPTPTTEVADEFLFELEGVDGHNYTSSAVVDHKTVVDNVNRHDLRDFNDSDNAEEAEDALDFDLDSSMPIPLQRNLHRHQPTTLEMMNFAKSLPIEIANSPINDRTIISDSDNELDNTVDIAASIKALAKSVHGEAVFGDLPRPRLRSQI